jgi:hypothetical protein
MTTATNNVTFKAASMYLAGALGMLPICCGGTKAPSRPDLPYKRDEAGEVVLDEAGHPCRTWEPFKVRLPTAEEIQAWYDRPHPAGIAIVCGEVSGNLELLDFDEDAAVIFPAWCTLVELECPGLVARLNVVRTPRPGYHVRYRCTGITIPGNDRLAQMPGPPGVNGKPTRVSLIETRGEGGYGLAPGSPGACHETGGEYVHHSGPKLSHVENITPQEREILWRVARSFSRLPPEEPKRDGQPRASKPRGDGDLLPGDDYDLGGPDWLEILEGWEVAHESGEVRYLRRPGKERRGWSATVGRCRGERGEELLYVFSTNADPFQPDQAYGKFRAYALLHHSGDFKAAAKELAKQGYGERRQKPGCGGGTAKEPAAARSAPKAKPRLLRPYRPFPLATLAEPLKSFVAETAKALNCDAGFVALPALAAVAACVGATRTLRLKGGWHEPSIIWGVIIGDSGTLKTPAYVKSVRHLFDPQQTLRGDYDVAYRTWGEAMRQYRARARKDKGDGSGLGPPPAEPGYRQLVTSDVTIEALAEALENNPRGLLVARDELSAWFGSFRRFKGRDGGTDLPNWLELHRAATIVVDRKMSTPKHLFIRRAVVSLTGSIQPVTWARTLTPEFLESGLAARILMCMPPKRAKTWSPEEVHPDTVRAYHDLLTKLRSLAFRPGSGRANLPSVLRLDAEALDVWIGFVNRWGQIGAAHEGAISAMLSKAEAYSARFAMLYHITGHAGLGADDLVPVGLEAVTAGIRLAEWFADEAMRIYQLLGESDQQRDSRRLVEFVQSRGGRMTARDLQRANGHRYPTAEDAQAALDTLVAAGVAAWEEPPDAGQGGRCARTLRLNPTPDTCSDADPQDGAEVEGQSDT